VNLGELELILRGLGVPEEMVGLGTRKDDSYCLAGNPDNGFRVFWYERGNELDLAVYQSEAAACYGLLGMLGERLQGPQPVAQGTGVAAAVGGAGSADPAVRSLLPQDAPPPSELEYDTNWPPADLFPEGFATPEGRDPISLPAGAILDSFGSTFTRFLYDAGTPFAERSLPAGYADAGYRRWLVSKPTPVWAGPVVPWFGQVGGATQYYALMPLIDLQGAGFVVEAPMPGSES